MKKEAWRWVGGKLRVDMGEFWKGVNIIKQIVKIIDELIKYYFYFK